MKILVWTRPSDFQGGDLRQAKILASRLKKQGIDIILSDKFNIDRETLNKYDIIHLIVFICGNVPEKIKVAKELNKKIVCSLLYRDRKYGE